MDQFFEITHSDGKHIMYIAVISASERERLTQGGFDIVRHSLSRRIWPWMLGEED